MPRFPALESRDVAAEFQDIIGSGMNLHRIMLHSPRTARVSRDVGLYLRSRCGLDARLRELAIIQVAYSAGSEYEYTHHLKIAEGVGVPDADLAAIATESEGGSSHLEPAASTVLRAAREMWTDLKIGDATFAALREVLSGEHIVDLVFTVAFYCGFVRLTGSLGVELEPQYLPYLARFPLG